MVLELLYIKYGLKFIFLWVPSVHTLTAYQQLENKKSLSLLMIECDKLTLTVSLYRYIFFMVKSSRACQDS